MSAAALLALASLASLASGSRAASIDAARPTVLPSSPLPAPEIAPQRERLEVQVSAASGRTTLAARGSDGAAWVFERRGKLVHARGRERAEWRVARSPGGTWALGEQRYPGLLVVRPLGERGLDVRVELDLEEYLCGVLAAELSVWSAPQAQLEAQAIAARSYALAELEHRAKSSRAPYLVDDTRDMAYRGDPALPLAVRARVRTAVAHTRGQVLRVGDQILGARFHAECGGHTTEGSRVFPECAAGSLPGVECAPCRAATPEPWSATLTRGELEQLARDASLAGELASLRPLARDAAGRWIELELESARGKARLSFESLRKRLGPERVRSAWVISARPAPGEPLSGGLALRGRGNGHGVGLCQSGARSYAERGWSAQKILAHYYPAARVSGARQP